MRAAHSKGVGMSFRPILCGAVVLAAALLNLSCVGLHQYRNVTVVPDGAEGYRDEICEASQPNSSTDRCAVEHRTYRLGEIENDYYFASVEFDDRGWFWDRKQMEGLMRLLYDMPDEEFLIFAYAHGWQHRADACDNNTVCFQRVLERLDFTLREAAEMESASSGTKSIKPRKVVGVYIGWRGRSGANKPARILSFFNRKRAANRVGIGGVTELLTRLNDFRRFKNRDRESRRTQLMIGGHSFGGQVIYKALSHSLIERASAMAGAEDILREDGVEVAGDYGYGIAHSFGDMVILVNPAFEGAAFEALQFAATNRCYVAQQRPSLLVVTSTADGATRTTFPIGRRLSNGRSRTRCRDQKQAVLRTVGHLPRYTSHVLKLRDAPADTKPEEQIDDGECGCPYLPPIDEIRAQMVGRDNQFYLDKQAIHDLRKENDGKIYELGHPGGLSSVDEYSWSSYGTNYLGEEMILERTGEYTANYPFLVVQTDKTFIPSHSGVYGERFTDFLRRFYIRHLAGEQLNFPQQCFESTDDRCLESAVTPCERSWKGRPDRACEPGPDGDPAR